MTPEEATLLVKIGEDLRKSFAAIIVKAFLFPLYAVCFFKAIYILRRKSRGWMMKINVVIMVLLFLMASSLISIDISNFVTEINTTFVHNPGVVLDQRYGTASTGTFNRVLVINAVYGYMTVLGDAIIIWRVQSIWGQGRRRWALFLLYLILLGSMITAFLLNYCVAHLGTQLFLGGFQHPPFCRDIQITSYAMPAATTFVATTFIAITYWDYRSKIKPKLPPTNTQSRVEKVLLILIESGFLYFIFFLYTVLCNEPTIAKAISARERLTFVNFMVSFSASIIVACYPTVVIILAHSDRTALENTSAAAVSTHLSFAAGGNVHLSRRSRNTETRIEETDLSTSISSQDGLGFRGKVERGNLPL